MMVALEKKIDFIGWITVKRANPNVCRTRGKRSSCSPMTAPMMGLTAYARASRGILRRKSPWT